MAIAGMRVKERNNEILSKKRDSAAAPGEGLRSLGRKRTL